MIYKAPMSEWTELGRNEQNQSFGDVTRIFSLEA